MPQRTARAAATESVDTGPKSADVDTGSSSAEDAGVTGTLRDKIFLLSSEHSTSKQKAAVFKILECWQVEVLILLMVLADLAVTGVEVGLDNGIFCIRGNMFGEPEPAVSHLQMRELHGQSSRPTQFGRSLLQGKCLLETNAVHEWPHGRSQYGRLLLQGVHMGITRHQDVVQVANADSASKPQSHGKIICEGRHSHRVVHLEHYFHLIGVTILCLFQLEIALKIWLEGKEFWTHAGHVVDCVVVTSSLMLELCLPWTLGLFQLTATASTGQVYADAYAALLLTLRLLRILRIFHGLFTIANTQWHRMKNMKRQLREALDIQTELRRRNTRLKLHQTQKQVCPELVGLDRVG